MASLIKFAQGDFDLAEDCLQDALLAASERWATGLPDNPAAWLLTTARRKLIDRARRRSTASNSVHHVREALHAPDEGLESEFTDERLRLIFTCCHPAIAPQARVALTLRTLCGLTTTEIARAFLTKEATLAQQLVRAKRRIRDAGIPYRVPEGPDLNERLPAVLAVIYLVFNEGYSATAGDEVVRHDLCREAIRLADLVVELLPGQTEARGLLALLLFQDSRRDARANRDGDLVVLEEQDRELWDREQIARASFALQVGLVGATAGPYLLQAAIAREHATAPRPTDTNWPLIVQLYDRLLVLVPNPVIQLNRAAAVAMAQGIEVGLVILDDPDLQQALDSYHWFHAARADLLRRAGRGPEASTAYRRALELVTNAAEKRFIERRLQELAETQSSR